MAPRSTWTPAGGVSEQGERAPPPGRRLAAPPIGLRNKGGGDLARVRPGRHLIFPAIGVRSRSIGFRIQVGEAGRARGVFIQRGAAVIHEAGHHIWKDVQIRSKIP
ncbi:hypothetical protein FKM82_023525 [Ascaphus truei]